ncbi:MAG: hypothetical protein EA426_09120 [Spirochaetaceae bacterium]|nr:MAG: hypothetical protein EA426_09120 [Spirochaetaceae bacterium]
MVVPARRNSSMLTEMTPLERFVRALRREPTDRVPVFDVPNNPALFREVLGAENRLSEGRPHAQLSRALGMDACMVVDRFYTGIIASERDWRDATTFLDEYGVEYRVSDASWPLAMPTKPGIVSRDDWARVVLPDVREQHRYREIRSAVSVAHRGRSDDIAVVAGVRGAFSTMNIAMGIENLSIALYDDPEFVLEMSRALSRYWGECAIMAVEAGADAVFIANDLGQNTGTIISPDDLRRFFLPPLFEQLAMIHETRVPVVFHSCGNIAAVLGELVDGGIDCYNNVQVSAGMDIASVKASYGDSVALMGNVDSTNIMPSADHDAIEDAVIETLRAAAVGGGHILATDHSFHQGIPVENVRIFLDAGARWGAYPLDLPEYRISRGREGGARQ